MKYIKTSTITENHQFVWTECRRGARSVKGNNPLTSDKPMMKSEYEEFESMERMGITESRGVSAIYSIQK